MSVTIILLEYSNFFNTNEEKDQISNELCKLDKRSEENGIKSILWLMLLFMGLHVFQALVFNFANHHFFNYELFGNIKINKTFLTVLFTFTNLPFVYLAINYNNVRNCQMFFTQFNLADIMVTMFSTFYIVVEDWQREQRQFNIVTNIIDRIMLKESTQFLAFK
jgi:hypothetical protein